MVFQEGISSLELIRELSKHRRSRFPVRKKKVDKLQIIKDTVFGDE
jgi:hypothetical protein